MITEPYTDEERNRLAHRIKKYAALCIAIAAIAVAASVTLCFFVTDENAAALQAANTAISVFGGGVALYLLFNEIIPAAEKKKYTERMLTGQKKTLNGFVTGVGKEITLAKGVTAREIDVTAADGTKVCLWLDSSCVPPERTEREVRFVTVQDRIFSYEVTR